MTTMQGERETNIPFEDKTDSQGKEVILVNDSNLVGSNLVVGENLFQSEGEISDKGPSYPEGEGMMSCPIMVEVQRQNMGIDEHEGERNNAGAIGLSSGTWKRRQPKPKTDNAVVREDVEVGSKRKNKSLSDQTDSTVTTKRRGEEEILEVSNLMKNEFESAVAARQHRRDQ